MPDLQSQYQIKATTSGNFIVHGTTSSNLPQPDWTMSDNGRLLLEGTAKIFFNSKNGQGDYDNLPVMGTVHPYDARLQCYQSDITISRDGIGYCEAKYVGIKSGSITDPDWSLSGATQDTSIKFHPEFERWCNQAGWSSLEKVDPAGINHYAITLNPSNGEFKSFGVAHPEVPGVEQFVVPTGNLKINFYTDNAATWGGFKLGSWLDQPPYCPTFLNYSGSGLNWLVNGLSVSQFGHLYKVEADLILSTLGKPVNKYMYDQMPAV